MITDRLNELGYSLGGSEVLKDLLSQIDLDIIASFPGAVIVSSVGVLDASNRISTEQDLVLDGEDVDLTQFGYVPSTPYSVLDRNYQELYTSRSTGYLGETVFDRTLSSSAEHASYYYITFETVDRTPVVILLWVTRELSPGAAAQTLVEIGQQSIQTNAFAHNFSVVVSGVPSTNQTVDLWLLLLAGSWQEPPTLVGLYENPNTRLVNCSSSSGQLLANIEDTWLAVVTLKTSLNLASRPQIDSIWHLRDSMGTGLERLLPLGDLIYIAGAGFSRLSLDPNVSSYQASRLTVNAQFGFGYDFNASVVSSNFTALTAGILKGYAGSGDAKAQIIGNSGSMFASGMTFKWPTTNFYATASLVATKSVMRPVQTVSISLSCSPAPNCSASFEGTNDPLLFTIQV